MSNARKFITVLTGTQEATTSPPGPGDIPLVPPVATLAQGAGSFELSDDEKTLYYDVYFNNLSSPVQNLGEGCTHIHDGLAGEEGIAVKHLKICLESDMKSGTINGEWTAYDKVFPLTKEVVKRLKEGHLYIDIHSQDNLRGELRGQIYSVL